MKQPWAWVTWLIVTVVILSITRNPLYLVLILMCVIFVGITLREIDGKAPQPFSLWKLAVWIILFSTLFNALTSHYGTTVLFTIPGDLPLLSGPVTLEAIVYGATNGLILTGMLACFMVLNLALTVRELVSLIPQAFFPVAVVTSIAVTYLPTTVRQFKLIREAQAIRGHQMRSVRDWLPLWMPLMVGGLEHAMQLAEAMTARGFASKNQARPGEGTISRVAMMLGLVMVSLGWIIQLSGSGDIGLVLILVGSLVILTGVWALSRKTSHTTYHQQGWSWKDWAGIAVSLAVLAICTLPIPGINHEALYYNPYPTLSVPIFDPLIGMAILGLLLPGLFRLTRKPSGQKVRSDIPKPG
jgi:energy-coupling factor transport system permease protein